MYSVFDITIGRLLDRTENLSICLFREFPFTLYDKNFCPEYRKTMPHIFVPELYIITYALSREIGNWSTWRCFGFQKYLMPRLRYEAFLLQCRVTLTYGKLLGTWDNSLFFSLPFQCISMTVILCLCFKIGFFLQTNIHSKGHLVCR